MKKPLKVVRLWVPFRPGEPDIKDLDDVVNFVAWNNAIRDAEQELFENKCKRQARAIKVIHDWLANRVTTEKATERVHQLVPDKAERAEISNILRTNNSAEIETPTDRAERKVAAKKAKLRGRARSKVDEGLKALFKAAVTGDAEAAVEVAEVAMHATSVLTQFLEPLHLDRLKSRARQAPYWPVLAVPDKPWETRVQKRMAELELGQGWIWLKIKFRKGRGADENYPARRWAKRAVRAVEGAQSRYRVLAGVSLSTEQMMEIMEKQGFDFGTEPQWVTPAMKLPRFSRDTAKSWAKAIRAMVREQVPDFHTLPEWDNQRRSLESRGRKGIGELQNKILDDIGSALETLAP